MTPDSLIFWIAAAFTLCAAVSVVLSKHPIYSALFLVLTFLGLSVFFLQLSAPFLAAVQVIVYAGAIMVLFLFVIMLLGEDKPISSETKLLPQAMATLILVLPLAGLIGFAILRGPQDAPPPAPNYVTLVGDGPHQFTSFGSVKAIGTTLFTDYLFAFEATSVVLLVAMIGVVVLAKRKL